MGQLNKRDVRTRFWNVIRNVNATVSIFHFLGTILSQKGQYKRELYLSYDRDFWASTVFPRISPSLLSTLQNPLPTPSITTSADITWFCHRPWSPPHLWRVFLSALQMQHKKRGFLTRATHRPPHVLVLLELGHDCLPWPNSTGSPSSCPFRPFRARPRLPSPITQLTAWDESCSGASAFPALGDGAESGSEHRGVPLRSSYVCITTPPLGEGLAEGRSATYK